MTESGSLRLRQLARAGAFSAHQLRGDERHGAHPFDSCPHPDCLLVREEIPGEPPILAEMQHANELVESADGPQEYQTRLIALALIARQFLRETRSPDGDGQTKSRITSEGLRSDSSQTDGEHARLQAGSIPAVSPPLSVVDDPSIDRECEPRDFSDLNEDHDE